MKRKVRGRTRAPFGGSKVIIEMHEDEITARPLYSRRKWHLRLDRLAKLILTEGL